MNPIIEQTRAAVDRIASADQNSLGVSWLDECMLAKQVNAEVMRGLTRDKSRAIVSFNPGLDLAANVIPVIVHDLPGLHALVGDGPATDGRVVIVSSQFVRNNRRALEENQDYQPWVSRALLCAAQRALGLPGSDGATLVDPAALSAAILTKSPELIGIDQPVGPDLFAKAADIGRDWKRVSAPADDDASPAADAQAWQDVLAAAQNLPGQMPSPEHFAYSRLSLLAFAATQDVQPVTGQLDQAATLMGGVSTNINSVLGSDVLVNLVASPLLSLEPGDTDTDRKISLITKAMASAGESATEVFRSSWISGLSGLFDMEKTPFIRHEIDAFKPFSGHGEREIASCLFSNEVDSKLLSVAVSERLVSTSSEDDAADFIRACQENGKPKADVLREFALHLRYNYFSAKAYPDQVSFDRCFAYSALNALEGGDFQKAWEGGFGTRAEADPEDLVESLEKVVSNITGTPSPLMRQALSAISQTYPQTQEWLSNTLGASAPKAPRAG